MTGEAAAPMERCVTVATPLYDMYRARGGGSTIISVMMISWDCCIKWREEVLEQER